MDIEGKEIEVATKIQADAALALQDARWLVVKDDQQAEEATDLVKRIQSRIRKAEDERKALVKPLNDHVKYINARFKQLTEPLNEAASIARNSLQGYLRTKAQAEREERRKAEEALLEAAQKAESEGDNARADAALSVATAVSTQQVKVKARGDAGLASTRKVYKVRVTSTDIYEMKRFLIVQEVPATYSLTSRSAPVPMVSLNMQEIHAAFAAGEKLPKGIEVLVEDDLVVR